VLGTVRDDELDADHPLRHWEHALRRSDQLMEIALAPLTRDESVELGRLVSHGRLSDQELAQHSLWAAGNPLFMLEMARAAVETAETGTPAVPSDVTDPAPEATFLPPKVYNVIQARLSKLSATAQTVAALAATVGRSFTVDLLLHAGELDEGQLVQALDELWRRRIIREGDAAAGDVYDFSHDRIRDVAYSRLSTVRRRFYHRALAAAMTDVHAPQLDPWSAQIAHHHERAGNHAEAVTFYTAAATWAAAQFAHTDTVRYLSRALDLIDTEDRSRRFELHKARAQAYQMQAARAEQARELDAMMALATAMDDDDKRTEVLLGRAALAEIQGNYADAVAVIEQIPWHRAPADDAQAGAIRLRHEVDAAVRLGSIYWNQGDYPRAEREYRRGLKAAQQVGDRAQEATILLHLGALNAYFGPYADALQISRAALDASRAVGNEEGQIWAQNQVGFLIIDQGDDDLRAAEAALTAGLDLARKTGNRTYIAKLANNLAMLYDRMGKYTEGHACLDEARVIAEKTGSARHQAFAINYRGNMLLNQGELDAAADAFARALAQFQAIGYRQGESKTLSELAVLYLIRGDAGRAMEHADAARTLATQIGIQRDLAAAHTRTGYVLESLGRWQAAEEMYTQARQLYRATGQQLRGLQPYAGCARIAWATGNQQAAIAYADDIATRVALHELDATCEAQWVAISYGHISGTSVAHSQADNAIRALRQPHLDAFRNAFGTPQSIS
jgi:predicted ATPase